MKWAFAFQKLWMARVQTGKNSHALCAELLMTKNPIYNACFKRKKKVWQHMAKYNLFHLDRFLWGSPCRAPTNCTWWRSGKVRNVSSTRRRFVARHRDWLMAKTQMFLFHRISPENWTIESHITTVSMAYPFMVSHWLSHFVFSLYWSVFSQQWK